MATPKPRTIKRTELGISIEWELGPSSLIHSQKLRQSCPCAECRELRGDSSHSAPLRGGKKPSSLRVVTHTNTEQTRLESIWGVGVYAIGVKWGDGHSTGIYTYDFLAELGRNEL